MKPTDSDVARIQALARSFPSLKDAPGVDPWDPDALDLWAAGRDGDAEWAGRLAAEFVLKVWDCAGLDRVSPRFDAVFGWYVWGPADRAAFRAWADAPFWLGDLRWQEGREPK
ncbi:MAG: hypothetical protein K2X87_04860 [Gemmataceae bacterium]|nr:hypothetical protein [Gemmataceae bacterium]